MIDIRSIMTITPKWFIVYVMQPITSSYIEIVTKGNTVSYNKTAGKNKFT